MSSWCIARWSHDRQSIPRAKRAYNEWACVKRRIFVDRSLRSATFGGRRTEDDGDARELSISRVCDRQVFTPRDVLVCAVVDARPSARVQSRARSRVFVLFRMNFLYYLVLDFSSRSLRRSIIVSIDSGASCQSFGKRKKIKESQKSPSRAVASRGVVATSHQW